MRRCCFLAAMTGVIVLAVPARTDLTRIDQKIAEVQAEENPGTARPGAGPPKATEARRDSETLCERTRFSRRSAGRPLVTYRNEEMTSAQGQTAIYSLSSITVPLGGWKIDAIAIYTLPRKPEGWLQVKRARLNIFPKKGDVPGAEDDPRRGKEVPVTIREVQKTIYEVRCSDLDLVLQPGEYWIGLTSICQFETHGDAGHIAARDVHDARFDDAVQSPDGDSGAQPYLREWKLHGPGLLEALGEHLSIKVQGWRLPRGRLLDWPAEEPKADRLGADPAGRAVQLAIFSAACPFSLFRCAFSLSLFSLQRPRNKNA